LVQFCTLAFCVFKHPYFTLLKANSEKNLLKYLCTFLEENTKLVLLNYKTKSNLFGYVNQFLLYDIQMANNLLF